MLFPIVKMVRRAESISNPPFGTVLCAIRKLLWGLPTASRIYAFEHALLTHWGAQRLSQKGEEGKRRYASVYFVLFRETEGCGYVQSMQDFSGLVVRNWRPGRNGGRAVQ